MMVKLVEMSSSGWLVVTMMLKTKNKVLSALISQQQQQKIYYSRMNVVPFMWWMNVVRVEG